MERLDPRSILIQAVEVVRSLVFPALIAVFSQVGRPQRFDRASMVFFVLIPVLMGVFGILIGVIKYFVTSYRVGDKELVYKRGGLWRQDRTVPLERIQNVVLKQGYLERLLSVYTVEVETASGATAEVSLKSVSKQTAETLKSRLMNLTIGQATPEEAARPAVYRATAGEIFLAGALQNRGFIVLAAIMGVFGQGIDDVAESVIENLQKTQLSAAAAREPQVVAMMVGLALIALIVGGWVLSIVYAFWTYFGFTVTRTEKGMNVSYGLVNTVQTVIPIRRVQSLDVRQPWLFRLFGLSQLFLQSVGGGTDGSQRSEGRVSTGRTLLAPICKPDTLQRLVYLLGYRTDLGQLRFVRSPARGLWLSGLGFVQFVAFSGGPLWALDKWTTLRYVDLLWVPLGVVWLIVAISKFLSWSRHGRTDLDGAMIVKYGALGQRMSIVPVGNVQAVTVSSGWLERKLGLADVSVQTAASAVLLNRVPTDEALSLADRLMRESYGRQGTGI